jgi:triacylglycerol lipase
MRHVWISITAACCALTGCDNPPMLSVRAAAGPGKAYPVVFLHGMAGFRELGSGPAKIEYFSGVKDALTAAGEPLVFITQASPYATSEVRASEIREQIDRILERTGAAKVNLIGHSQGGLDARFLASPGGLGIHSKVASVTTISTPHRGSRIADLALQVAPDGIAGDVVSAFLSIFQRSLYALNTDENFRAQVTQLTPNSMAAFNRTIVDAPGVVYESYAGRSNLRTGVGVCDDSAVRNDSLILNAAGPTLLATALFLEGGSPPEINDGLVTVASAKWGQFVRCMPADHFDEAGLGVSVSFNAVAFYKSVVARIRALGL